MIMGFSRRELLKLVVSDWTTRGKDFVKTQVREARRTLGLTTALAQMAGVLPMRVKSKRRGGPASGG